MEDGSTPPRLTPATRDDPSIDSVEILQTFSQDSPARDSMSTEWTDEKHSLYLKSMEASFVDDLYNSFRLIGWRSQREHSSDSKFSGKKHDSTNIAYGQFKVLQSGCWANIKSSRHESQVEDVEGSEAILGNPWIRHFRSSRRKQILTSPTLQEKTAFGSLAVHVSGKMPLTSTALAANLEQFPASHSHLCHCDNSVDISNTEVTDQNFIDEDTEVEKASHMSNAKRRKSSVVSFPTDDQFVPFGKSSANTNVSSSDVK